MRENKEKEESKEERIETAQENYMDAGQTTNKILITLLVGLFATSTVFEGVSISIALFFFSLAIIAFIFHQVRKMRFNYEYIKDPSKDFYEEREIMVYHKTIPIYLFAFYVLAVLSLISPFLVALFNF